MTFGAQYKQYERSMNPHINRNFLSNYKITFGEVARVLWGFGQGAILSSTRTPLAMAMLLRGLGACCT